MATKVKIAAVTICAAVLLWLSWDSLVGREDSQPPELAQEVASAFQDVQDSRQEPVTANVRREKLRAEALAAETRGELDREMVFLRAYKKDIGESDDLSGGSWLARNEEELMIRLEPGIRLRGLVLWDNGVPAANVDVRVTPITIFSGGVVRPPKPTRTKHDGCFEMDLRPRNGYKLEVRYGERRSEVEVSTITPGDKEVVVRFLGATSICGFLLDSNDRPVADGTVRLWESVDVKNRDRNADSPLGLSLKTESLKTEKDGSFKFDVKRYGIYQLLGQAKGAVSSELAQVEVTQANPHAHSTLRLLAPTMIAEALRYEGGKPARGLRVFLRAETRGGPNVCNNGELLATQDSSAVIERGRYTLPGLSLGFTYNILIIPKHYAPVLVGPVTTSKERHVFDVRLQRFGEMLCRVVDEDGRAIINILVFARPVAAVPATGYRRAMPTSAGGILRLPKTAPGKYEVYALHNGQRLGSKEVDVRPGALTEVELRIKR